VWTGRRRTGREQPDPATPWTDDWHATTAARRRPARRCHDDWFPGGSPLPQRRTPAAGRASFPTRGTRAATA